MYRRPPLHSFSPLVPAVRKPASYSIASQLVSKSQNHHSAVFACGPEQQCISVPTGHDCWYADDHTACMDHPSTHHGSSYSQAGTQRPQGLAPILKRRRAHPVAPQSPPALGAIPFRTAGTGAATPRLGSQTLHREAARSDAGPYATHSLLHGVMEEEETEGTHTQPLGAAAKPRSR